MKKLLICAFLAFSMLGCNDRHNNDPITHPNNLSKSKLLIEHNKHRNSPLEMDGGLEEFAQSHAEWMASKDNLKHSDLNVSGNWMRLGENIAWGQNNEEYVTRSWMKSRGHRANITNSRFTHVGFGYSKTSDGRLYWCAVFGG